MSTSLVNPANQKTSRKWGRRISLLEWDDLNKYLLSWSVNIVLFAVIYSDSSDAELIRLRCNVNAL